MGKRLYVGNLSWDTTEDNLRSTFSQGGRTVSGCDVVADRDTGRPRGFAFVEMSSDDEAKAAITDLDGFMLDGRPIRVNEAQERAARPGGGSKGPRGGRGGDRY